MTVFLSSSYIYSIISPAILLASHASGSRISSYLTSFVWLHIFKNTSQDVLTSIPVVLKVHLVDSTPRTIPCAILRPLPVFVNNVRLVCQTSHLPGLLRLCQENKNRASACSVVIVFSVARRTTKWNTRL